MLQLNHLAGFGAGAGGDPFFANVSLLLHFDGSNGSTTFTDNSPNAHTITAAGNAALSTSGQVFGTACGLFDGTGDYITAPANSAFSFGTGNFTVEGFYKSTQTAAGYVISQNDSFANANWWAIVANASSAGDLYVYENTNARITASGTSINNGSDHFMQLIREGNSLKLYLDGVQVGSTYTTSHTFGNASVGLIFAQRWDISASVGSNCRMDEWRITKGVARPVGVPTAAFPNG